MTVDAGGGFSYRDRVLKSRHDAWGGPMRRLDLMRTTERRVILRTYRYPTIARRFRSPMHRVENMFYAAWRNNDEAVADTLAGWKPMTYVGCWRPEHEHSPYARHWDEWQNGILDTARAAGASVLEDRHDDGWIGWAITMLCGPIRTHFDVQALCDDYVAFLVAGLGIDKRAAEERIMRREFAERCEWPIEAVIPNMSTKFTPEWIMTGLLFGYPPETTASAFIDES